MAEIKKAIREHRLITLTGSGGTGKTRLSLQVGTDLLDQFPDGTWFIELAPIANPEIIAQTILADHTPEICALCERLRGLAREAMPTATEHGYAGWHAIAYRHPAAGYVCGIFPFADSVRFLFEHGVLLHDIDRVLTGGGKQTRYIDLKPGDSIPADALRVLIAEAVALRSKPGQRK